MPEGPEIRLAADRVAKTVAGRRLTDVVLTMPSLRRFESRLVKSRIARIDTRGKAMLTRFSNGLTLYSHNQLYGRWYVTDGDPPATNRSLRVALHTNAGAAFLYSASDVAVLTERQLANHPFLTRLGPDALDAKPAAVARRLDSQEFRRRKIGGLYLNQQFLAGIGNYLRSEILFFARVHYEDTPSALNAKAIMRLARTSCAIAQRSYRTRGVTNPVQRARALKRQGLRYRDYRFAVFGREGQACYECSGEVQRAIVAGRRLYFCPGCQRPAD